jgi:hypothetical protein
MYLYAIKHIRKEIKMQSEKLKLQRKLRNLEEKIKTLGPIMRGSIVELKLNCGNKKCKCYQDKKFKHPAKYFSVNIDKKTKLIYLGDKKIKIAQKYNDNYLKIWELINQMTLINMELIKIQ